MMIRKTLMLIIFIALTKANEQTQKEKEKEDFMKAYKDKSIHEIENLPDSIEKNKYFKYLLEDEEKSWDQPRNMTLDEYNEERK